MGSQREPPAFLSFQSIPSSTIWCIKASSRETRKKANAASGAILNVINSNIKTLTRIRRTHAKFAALNMNLEEGFVVDEPPDLGEEDIEETIDERPWRSQ
ncbi:hypothetical protein BJ138DRAFT_1213129 [Hygrophoropsis aurantiaca]|uniref:Uncharacterized protein n=1 Tax=Hygrophoropsis aurantiaca TaxID=72124 RepID=A0ACB8A3D6_9AGAM|nr:hypothetical protein BJ138DRAFT_1213129 [Hygrophoropsis aurantiaca]